MPKFLFLTTISRHDARLSSTTHCALRASRINYNLTNLSRCNSFSYSTFLVWTYSTLSSDSPAHLLCQNSFQCFSSDSPGTLSLSCQSHHNNLSHKKKMQISHATQLSVLQLSRCHLFSSRLPLLSGTPVAYTYHISHTALGHRYFNLAMSCGICLRYAHASHKPASAFRLPNL